MKILVSIEHPAWVHQFKNIIMKLNNRGDEVLVLAIDKDHSARLLDVFGIRYSVMARTTGKSIPGKSWLFVRLCVSYTLKALSLKPDIFIGRASPMMAVAAFFARRPHLVYEDTEVSKFSLSICRMLSTKILTPRSFLTDLGHKQERVDTFKELFYLHPNCFAPDSGLLRGLCFDPDEEYIVLRFVAWNASHDIGKKGLSADEKIKYVRRLSELCRVYVSSEAPLTHELEPYAIPLPYEYVHHALAFARLCISEGASMASEAAILGVHAIYINDIVSGTTNELCEHYGLMFNYQHTPDKYERAFVKALELLQMDDIRVVGQKKRMAMLQDKADISDLYLKEIDELANPDRIQPKR